MLNKELDHLVMTLDRKEGREGRRGGRGWREGEEGKRKGKAREKNHSQPGAHTTSSISTLRSTTPCFSIDSRVLLPYPSKVLRYMQTWL